MKFEVGEIRWSVTGNAVAEAARRDSGRCQSSRRRFAKKNLQTGQFIRAEDKLPLVNAKLSICVADELRRGDSIDRRPQSTRVIDRRFTRKRSAWQFILSEKEIYGEPV